jgi:hypothetical protein
MTPCNRTSIRFRLIDVGSGAELETPAFDNRAMMVVCAGILREPELQLSSIPKIHVA